MTKVTEFEELADVGKRFLTRFNRVTAMFRTVELQKTSNNISRIIDANWNEHMKTYVEAGCKQQSQSVQNMYNSHSCVLGLRDNLKNGITINSHLKLCSMNLIA
ncbi:uncharacterized protein LOC121982244 [Zingiber officinale]|uniref:uncharacterized protein LOC121982244 n=1 Tax=Zingiber officinale TaxID=94328 RepID=UPI001C4B875A|nr:uncharacterized protein LOC121982244 [Zingiber officinale]